MADKVWAYWFDGLLCGLRRSDTSEGFLLLDRITSGKAIYACKWSTKHFSLHFIYLIRDIIGSVNVFIGMVVTCGGRGGPPGCRACGGPLGCGPLGWDGPRGGGRGLLGWDGPRGGCRGLLGWDDC